VRVLITGGAGFIGSNLADAVVADGHEVHVLDDLSSGKRSQVPDAATFHQHDIRSADAARLLRDVEWDVIAHLAAQIDVRRSVTDPAFDASVNILGALNLLEALRATGSSARFIFISTGGALYGDDARVPTPEETSRNPDAPYGIAKLSVEYYAAYYARVHALDTVVLRLGNVYGPRQDPLGEAGVVAIFCGRIAADRPLTIFGDGEQVRDYVYVGDVANAIRAAATVPLPPPGPVDSRAFNVGTGIGTSVLDLGERIGRVAGRSPTFEFAPRRPGELQRSILDPAKAESALGWRAATTLDDGLRATYEWFVAQGAGPGR
jgi:UDP-glucose 4-epimerase